MKKEAISAECNGFGELADFDSSIFSISTLL